MKISINPIALKERILNQINRIVQDCVLILEGDKIKSVATLDAGGIIVYAEQQIGSNVEAPTSLNIKNINKLASVLNCVIDEVADIIVESNHIKYSSNNFKFKFHLTEDGVITKPKLKIEKIVNMSYSTSATLNMADFNAVIKASSYLNTDVVRLYFYTKLGEERGIYCDITNRQIANSDSMTIRVSNDFDGDPISKDLICDVEHIRRIAVSKNSTLRIYFDNKVGYTVFDVIEEKGYIRYILPTLAK